MRSALSTMAALSALAIGTVVPHAVLVAPAYVGSMPDAWQTGAGFVPTVTAVAFMLASMALQVWPEVARGHGWLVTSCGVVMTMLVYGARVQGSAAHLVLAAGIGLALAGLCQWAVIADWRDRALTVAGFVTGALVSQLVWGLMPDALGDQQVIALPALVILTTVLAMFKRQQPAPALPWDRRPTLVVAGAGVLVMAGVSISEVTGLLAVAVAVVILGFYAGYAGGARDVGSVLLGAGVAAPLYLVVTAPIRPRADMVVAIVLGTAAGVWLGRLAGKALVVQAAGLAIAAAGSLAGYHMALAATGFGCAIALAAGLISAPRHPSTLRIGLGLAALLFTSQGLGQAGPTVVPTAAAAALLLVVMWWRRRVTATGEREAVGVAP